MSKKEIEKEKELAQYLLEDEDDFEEFEGGMDAERNVEKIDSKMWREDWDDEDMTDDFTLRLKK